MIVISQCGTQQAPVLILFTRYYPVWGHHTFVDQCRLFKPPMCNKLQSTGGGVEYQTIFIHVKLVVWLHIFFPISPYIETSSAYFQLIHTIPLTASLPLTSNPRGPLSRSDWSTAWDTFTTSCFSSFTAYKATLQNSSFTTVVNRNWDARNPSPCCRGTACRNGSKQSTDVVSEAAAVHFSKLLFNYRNTGSEVTKEFL